MSPALTTRDPIPQSAHDDLSEYPEFLRELLFRRGITDKKAANAFLNPDYELHTHDPFLLKNMDRVVDRILLAIKNNEKIAIYSDYDCDGIPGGVVLHDFFKAIGCKNFINYIPHRNKEGFGLNTAAIEELAQQEVNLIITVDCGTTDSEPVARAVELGVDVIITDHHTTPAELPPAYAIINPKQEGDEYPFKGICGATIAYKVAQAVLSRNRFNVPVGHEKWWLDMVGIATIADMVPLVDENRVLAHYGLKVLRMSRRKGIRQLCSILRMNQGKLSEDDIGFMIAPRINAASRMDAPMRAFELLTASTDSEAREKAIHLDRINNERKGHVAAIVKEIKKKLKHLLEIPPVIVSGNPEWKPSLMGLVAGSLAEEYRRPVFLWGKEGGTTIKGSCRSDSHVSVVDIMSAAPSGVFVDFGGHDQTGGFVVDNEHVHTLEETLVNAYETALKTAIADHVIEIDKEIPIDDVRWDLHRSLQQLAPFGMSNPKPKFRFTNGTLTEIGSMGKAKNHLKLKIGKGADSSIEALCFFKGPDDFGIELVQGMAIDIIGTMEVGGFNGKSDLRIRIDRLALPL